MIQSPDDNAAKYMTNRYPQHSSVIERQNWPNNQRAVSSAKERASGNGPYNVSAAQNTKGNKAFTALLWVSPPRYLWPNKRCNVGIAPYNVSTAQNIKRN